jgi:hypothetical protein
MHRVGQVSNLPALPPKAHIRARHTPHGSSCGVFFAEREARYDPHMPRVSEFFGIVIYFYFNDHAPPHFHARYGEDEALIDIRSLALIAGHLPPRARAMVTEWATIHADELQAAWNACQRGDSPGRIDPLQ